MRYLWLVTIAYCWKILVKMASRPIWGVHPGSLFHQPGHASACKHNNVTFLFDFWTFWKIWKCQRLFANVLHSVIPKLLCSYEKDAFFEVGYAPQQRWIPKSWLGFLFEGFEIGTISLWTYVLSFTHLLFLLVKLSSKVDSTAVAWQELFWVSHSAGSCAWTCMCNAHGCKVVQWLWMG